MCTTTTIYSKLLDTYTATTRHTDPQDSACLQHSMGFKYYAGIGELIFATINCLPDMLFTIVFLNQFSNQPALYYCQAVKRIFCYLHATTSDGIHYWRQKPKAHLPFSTPPTLHSNNYAFTLPRITPFYPNAFADTDWIANLATRKSTGGNIMFLTERPICCNTIHNVFIGIINPLKVLILLCFLELNKLVAI